MKSENGETEKLQVVNGKDFKPPMALESINFFKISLFSVKNGMFRLKSVNFKRNYDEKNYEIHI